jgi:hypothetical protein
MVHPGRRHPVVLQVVRRGEPGLQGVHQRGRLRDRRQPQRPQQIRSHHFRRGAGIIKYLELL